MASADAGRTPRRTGAWRTIRMKRKGQAVRGLWVVASIFLFDPVSAETGRTGPAYGSRSRIDGRSPLANAIHVAGLDRS